MGVSDDARVYGGATYHCTSAHGPACPARGAVGEHPPSPADDDDLEEDDDAVVIMHMGHVAKDVDVAQIMRLFEGGAFEEALEKAKRKKNGGGEAAKAARVRNDGRDAKVGSRFISRLTRGLPNGDFATDDARNDDAYGDETAFGVTGRALEYDADVGRDGVRSTPSRETRKVEFLNARATTCAIYWVDFDGKETHYVDLPPGMTTLMSTFATHSWVARDMASTHAIAMFTVRARQSPDETPTQRFVVVDAERGDLAYAEAVDDDDDDDARDASGPAPAEPDVDVDAGTRGGEGERGEEGEAGNANPDGKKTRGGADASAETAAREL